MPGPAGKTHLLRKAPGTVVRQELPFFKGRRSGTRKKKHRFHPKEPAGNRANIKLDKLKASVAYHQGL